MPDADLANIALGIVGVSHAYGARKAVDDVNLTVGAGELVCLVGPSGCGKTTLLRISAGLEPLQEGRIVIDGCAIAEAGYHVPPEARGVGFVFQDYALFPHLTVARNVGFGLHRMPARERTDRVNEVLVQVGMQDLAEAYPHQLSGGMQQRVALARALAPRPRVMLLDEPFSGLDSVTKNHLYAAIRRLCADFALTLIIVSHDPLEAAALCSHAAVLEQGRIAEIGALDALLRNPTSETLRSFVAQLPPAAGAAERAPVAGA